MHEAEAVLAALAGKAAALPTQSSCSTTWLNAQQKALTLFTKFYRRHKG
jgi:hypothetical protein